MNSVERSRGRNNYFTCCFRPADTDKGSVKRSRKDCPGGPPVFAISVRGGDKMVLPKILTSLSQEKSKVSPDGGGRGTEERSRRSFSRIFKSVLLKNPLVKKFSSRKARQKSFQTKSNIVSEKIKKASNAAKVNPTPDKTPEADSSRWASPNSSSTTTTSTPICSSLVSSYGASPVESKQVDKPTSTEKARECSSPTVGFCVLLVCLVVLTFWGRVVAILCTSMFLFLVRRRIERSHSVDLPVNGIDLPVNDVDSEAYKKKVIMEGLLDRNRSRVRNCHS
ncbi:hypothetical protein RHSIM_Rhsim06G0192100 [Rhododendron simsii]|uniref:Uncharacterized protein n=1 Tax=Rhododendron simsii TaxID=118357 RepID=A0A834GQ91_RHOSS|nr:hypothetical protein RHSIM_Rhsim06G0192100 [Rhododendron simsii]